MLEQSDLAVSVQQGNEELLGIVLGDLQDFSHDPPRLIDFLDLIITHFLAFSFILGNLLLDFFLDIKLLGQRGLLYRNVVILGFHVFANLVFCSVPFHHRFPELSFWSVVI
jgi:hypothetical protein